MRGCSEGLWMPSPLHPTHLAVKCCQMLPWLRSWPPGTRLSVWPHTDSVHGEFHEHRSGHGATSLRPLSAP